MVASVSFNGGTTWHVLPNLQLNSATGNGGDYSVDLATLLGNGESFGNNAVVNFEAVTANGGNGYIAIDNLNIAVATRTPVNDGSNDYSSAFSEGGRGLPSPWVP